MAAAVVGEIAGDLGMALLHGALGEIGRSVGARIFNYIFGNKSEIPDYFGEVYKTIKQIVQEELEQTTIDEIDGEIKGVKDWVINVYNPRKDSGAGKKELYTMMQENPAYDLAVHMLAVLQQERYAELGLGVFVIGAGMHLTLLQELALVDPSVSHPNKSSYAISIKKYAEEYAAFVDATYDSIEKKHIQAAINLVTTTSLKDIQRVKEDLVESLHDPKGVANLWRKLMEQPLPLNV